MKKTYILEELDCAHCAQKMQDSINKLEGVKECSITFMTKKMTLEVEENGFDKIFKAVKKAVAKVDPDVEVLEA